MPNTGRLQFFKPVFHYLLFQHQNIRKISSLIAYILFVIYHNFARNKKLFDLHRLIFL